MNPDATLRELANILGGTADRAAKASQAAEAIRAAGGYRWVGIYDVADQLVVNLAWSVRHPHDGRVIGTLDVESEQRAAFGPADQRALERAAAALLPLWTM